MVTEAEVAKFVERVQAFIDSIASKKTLPYRNVLSIDMGKRYARIVTNDVWKDTPTKQPAARSVYCFVDLTNGDILKSASWKAPAKGARGNIAEEDVSQALTEHGAKYR